ncbi:ABC transporter permease [Umbribacter vaginalis]
MTQARTTRDERGLGLALQARRRVCGHGLELASAAGSFLGALSGAFWSTFHQTCLLSGASSFSFSGSFLHASSRTTSTQRACAEYLILCMSAQKANIKELTMKQAKFWIETFLRLILLLVAASIITFALVNAAPIDPVAAYAGGENTFSKEQLASIAAHWGFDKPPVERYFMWIGGLLHGDGGISVIYQRPVVQILCERAGNSLLLMGCAWVLSGIIGFAAGIVCGLYPRSIADKLLKGICIVLSAAPTFWVGLVCLSIFAVALGWFPLGHAYPVGLTPDQVTWGQRIHHLILPALVLAVSGIGNITLQTREKVIEIMQSDMVTFAKARGETTRQIITRHLLRNISLPAITLQFAYISEVFGGSVLAEQVFAYPGLGNAVVQSALSMDIPLLLGVALVSAVFVFVGNFIANVLYGIIDPRIKRGAELHD